MGIVGDFVESLRGFCVNFVGILRKFGSDCVGICENCGGFDGNLR